MIFRRVPRDSRLRLIQSPHYECHVCDVRGVGDRCWMCQSPDVERIGNLLVVAR